MTNVENSANFEIALFRVGLGCFEISESESFLILNSFNFCDS